MSVESIKLVGYWNKSTSDPEITFKVPEKGEDKELVIINLTRVPETDSRVDITMSKSKAALKKVRKELRNLDIISRRLK